MDVVRIYPVGGADTGFPSKYDSVCVVQGTRREAGNEKLGMAQIDQPKEVLKIEGENLQALQAIYRELYAEPPYALSDDQKRARDNTFNDRLKSLIAEKVQANQQADRNRRQQGSQEQARPNP